MEIAVYINFSAFKRFLDHLLDGLAFGEEFGTRTNVLAVQIVPRQTAPVISNYNSVWVEHGHNFKNVPISKSESNLFVSQQVLDKPFHHV